MGSTSVKVRQAGDLVAILLAGAGVGLLALACARPTAIDPTPTGATQAASVGDAGERTDAGEARRLRVGTSGDYAPFSVWPTDVTEPEGFSVAVARAFAASRGQQIEWVRLRWSELAADLEAGRFDLALSGITVRPDRSTLGRFSLPLTESGAVALVLVSSPLATSADLERPGLRIAVNRGGHLERVARTRFARARIEAVDTNARVPTRLTDGRADAVLTDDLEARVWQSQLPPTRAIGPLTRDRKAAWFPTDQAELLAAFDRWLLAAETAGELARLRERYGLAAPRTALALPALLARLDERLALMPAVARAKRVLGLAIEDPAREARVRIAAQDAAVRAAREFATRPLPAPALRRFVDAQLAAARFVQDRELAALAGREAAGLESKRDALAAELDPEAARAELDLRLRPAVSFLTERIVWLAVASAAAQSSVSDPERASTEAAPAPRQVRRAAVAEALSAHRLPAELEAEIQAALEALVTPARRARPAARARPTRPAPRDTSPSA